jgi:hypothetical protein
MRGSDTTRALIKAAPGVGRTNLRPSREHISFLFLIHTLFFVYLIAKVSGRLDWRNPYRFSNEDVDWNVITE